MTPETIKRILVINVNWLGDVLFSTAALRAIRKKYPQSFIACLLPLNVAAVLKDNPHINELIMLEEDNVFRGFLAKCSLILKLRGMRFDAAFIFHRSRTRAFIAWLSGIPIRIGFATNGRTFFLSHAPSEPVWPLHRVDCYLTLVRSFGIADDGRECDFFVTTEDRNRVRVLLAQEGVSLKDRLVVLHAGGNWPLKRWRTDDFALLAKRLYSLGSVRIVLCGTSSEKDLADQIVLKGPEGMIVWSGKTSLGELGALMERAALVVSNDSGPLHLAASLGKVSVLALFGPTLPELTGPISKVGLKILRKEVGCSLPCLYRDCHYRVCLDLLTPEEVFQEAKLFLEPIPVRQG